MCLDAELAAGRPGFCFGFKFINELVLMICNTFVIVNDDSSTKQMAGLVPDSRGDAGPYAPSPPSSQVPIRLVSSPSWQAAVMLTSACVSAMALFHAAVVRPVRRYWRSLAQAEEARTAGEALQTAHSKAMALQVCPTASRSAPEVGGGGSGGPPQPEKE